jgi:DHA2 family methylenomycin A resistance protein-like MFS transporter
LRSKRSAETDTFLPRWFLEIEVIYAKYVFEVAITFQTPSCGCLALLGIGRGTSYWAIGAQLTLMGAGLGPLVPPLTSTLLGSVEKSRSGIAAGVFNSTRQTGSVLGVALFGSLAGQANAFMAGTHWSQIISACLLLAAGATIWFGASTKDS